MTEQQLSPSEVQRRLPALRYIDDDAVRRETRQLSRTAPDYFWTRPGSRRGYHNAHSNGLWKHTLKLSVVIDRLGDSWVERGFVSDLDLNLAHAAAILHDQRKEGDTGGQTARDHDLQMAQVVREETGLDERVADAVAAHMGPWYEGPTPAPGTLESLVHIADMIASAEAINIELPEPVPSELQPYAPNSVPTE